MEQLLTCKNLCKSFGDKKAVKKVTLEIPTGKIVGLIGKNGAGKSTLIKLFNGLLAPDEGEILVEGNPIGVESKKIISFLPERTFLDRAMTVEQTIHFFEDFFEDFDAKKARRLLKDLDLDTRAKISTLSKGMQEKVQLTLVMSRKAKLYILDEPLGGVDPATRDYILDTILGNFDKGASMLISTHLISDIERILDEVVIIDKGEIRLVENAEKLRKRTKKSIDKYFREEFKNA